MSPRRAEPSADRSGIARLHRILHRLPASGAYGYLLVVARESSLELIEVKVQYQELAENIQSDRVRWCVCESDSKSNKETLVWTGEWNTEPPGSDLAHPDKELELLTLDPS